MCALLCAHTWAWERDAVLDFPHFWTLGSDSHRAQKTHFADPSHSFLLVLSTFVLKMLSRHIQEI